MLLWLCTAMVFAGIAMAFLRLMAGPSAQDRLNAVAVIGSGIIIYLLIHIFHENSLLPADIVLLVSILGFSNVAIFSFYLRRGD